MHLLHIWACYCHPYLQSLAILGYCNKVIDEIYNNHFLTYCYTRIKNLELKSEV